MNGSQIDMVFQIRHILLIMVIGKGKEEMALDLKRPMKMTICQTMNL